MLETELMSRLVIGTSKFVQYFIFIKILDSLEKRKYEKKYLDIIFLLIGILDSTILFNRSTQYYDFIINLKWIAFILFTKLNYKLSNFKVLSYYMIYTMAYYITWEFVFSIVFFLVTGQSMHASSTSENNFNIISIIESTITIIINISYIHIIKILKNIDKEKINIMLIIGCVLSNFVIAFVNSLPRFIYNIKIDYYNELTAFNINITPRLSFINGILLLIIVLKTIKDIKEKSEENLLKEKIDMQYNYYLNLQEAQNKVKRLYHDMSNHMMCIKNMSSQKEDVNQYIDEVSKELNGIKEIYSTGNMILDIVLNEKQADCNENNINLFCDINFSKCNFIDMIDVCSVFSNILDNAIEACNKIKNDEKYIKIRGTFVKSYYVIRCENSKVNKIKIKNNRIISSKKDKFIHGIGLKSVKSSLKKYDGELEIEDFEDKFLVQIYIPIDKNMTVGV
ncbi:MAG: ATP-binding protein [Paeniclostridium sordellii]|nr:ATP-binding protein [Paeniclostridium sordellii]